MTLRLLHDPDAADWPDNDAAQRLQRYAKSLNTIGIDSCVENAKSVTMSFAQSGATILPVTTAGGKQDNSYVCSPYCHYISYARQEAERYLKPWLLRVLVQAGMDIMGAAATMCELDRAVLVNNWLLSTNLYPEGDIGELKQLCRALPEWFPDRAIVFRSVDFHSNPGLAKALIESNFRLVLSRQVWFQDPQKSLALGQIAADRRVIKKNGYLVSSDLSDPVRGQELYAKLYLQRHSGYNPAFSAAFLSEMHQRGLFKFRGLEKDGRLDAVMGWFDDGRFMTQPIFGYDTSLPVSLGLYRHLSLLVLEEGQKAGLKVHASGGAGLFKRNRGGVSAPEYNAVYFQHLARKRRLPWLALERITRCCEPMLKRHCL